MKPTHPILILEDEFKEIVTHFLPVFCLCSNANYENEPYEVFIQKTMPKHIKGDLSFYDVYEWPLGLISAALIIKQALYFYGISIDISYCQFIAQKLDKEQEINFEEMSFESLVCLASEYLTVKQHDFLKGQLVTKDFNMFLNLEFGLEDSPEKQAFKESISAVLQPDTLVLDLNCQFGKKAANCYAKAIKNEDPEKSIELIKKIQKIQ